MFIQMSRLFQLFKKRASLTQDKTKHNTGQHSSPVITGDLDM